MYQIKNATKGGWDLVQHLRTLGNFEINISSDTYNLKPKTNEDNEIINNIIEREISLPSQFSLDMIKKSSNVDVVYEYVIKPVPIDIPTEYIKNRINEITEVLEINRLDYYDKVQKEKFPSRSIKIKTKGQIKHDKLTLGTDIHFPVYVNIFNKPIIQCNKCQKYNQPQTYCRSETFKCGICAQDHATRLCLDKINQNIEVTTKCVNCKNDHPARSKLCSERKKYIERRNRNKDNVQSYNLNNDFPVLQVSDNKVEKLVNDAPWSIKNEIEKLKEDQKKIMDTVKDLKKQNDLLREENRLIREENESLKSHVVTQNRHIEKQENNQIKVIEDIQLIVTDLKTSDKLEE